MIQIYDSLQAKKIAFEKAPGEAVSMYVCGPTVYDRGHLGHGRSAVAFDVVRRFFEFMGHPVTFVFNYTDIDDKMIQRAQEEGISVAELSDRISPLYDKDYAALGVKKPTHNPKATDYIKEMVALIQTLENKGHTYVLEDGVYFDITTFSDYGKLSHQKLDELNAGARVEERTDKRNHQDFVLWKLKKEGEPAWPSPWGEGRPGWHIECSAMSRALLGETFDIHGGGLDLKFPHHECELAQSEGAHGVTFARTWMHNGYITVDAEKMSKSLGNFFTLEAILERFDAKVVRFFFLSAHYRSPIEFSLDALEQAATTLERLIDVYLENTEKNGVDEAFLKTFKEKMGNDFDTPGALAALFEWLNTQPIHIRETLEKIDEVFQLLPTEKPWTKEILELIEQRESARQEKNWTEADRIRDELLKENILIKDTARGPLIKKRLKLY